MLCMRRALGGEGRPEDALARAGSTPLDHADPELTALFLGLWAVLSRQNGRVAEMAALARRAKDVLPPDCAPEIRVMVRSLEVHLHSATGDLASAESLHRELLALIPLKSPRRAITLTEFASFLGSLGRECEVDAELDDLTAAPRSRADVARARLIQCAETGRLEEAEAHLNEAESDEDVRTFFRSDLERCRGILHLLRAAQGSPGEVRRRAKEFAAGMPAQAPGGPSAPPRVAALLLAQEPEEALESARRAVRESADAVFCGPTFTAFDLIRAELACGHGGAARRLLDARHRRGNLHFLDGFFLARAELLAGRENTAARSFQAAAGLCARNSAGARLDLELKLACELSRPDVLRLAAGPAGTTPAATGRLAVGQPGRVAVPESGAELVGVSPAMERVRRAVTEFAPLDTPVLITGETGTGKEMVARAIHRGGPRAARPFLAINCGAIAEGLLESELFGHERGAFTGASRARKGLFEAAGRGTVLLDEVGETPPRLQVALLRVLEAGEIRPVGGERTRRVSCRILAATNADLSGLAAEGRFRNDLFYRLRRLEISIPPIRERREDILPLADVFLAEMRTDGRRPVMSSELREELRIRAWPGNARQLRNAIERMRLLNSDKSYYELADLEPESPAEAAERSGPGAARSEDHPEPAPRSTADAQDTTEILRSGRSRMRRLDRLAALFRRHGKLTRAEVSDLQEVSLQTATRDLKALCAQGVIERVEPSRSPRSHYFRLCTRR
jgi:DNA-binding NtrC family response regulator